MVAQQLEPHRFVSAEKGQSFRTGTCEFCARVGETGFRGRRLRCAFPSEVAASSRRMQSNTTQFDPPLPNPNTPFDAFDAGIVKQFWAAYVPCDAQHKDAVQLTLEQIDVIIRLTDKYRPKLTMCNSAFGKRRPPHPPSHTHQITCIFQHYLYVVRFIGRAHKHACTFSGTCAHAHTHAPIYIPIS